MMVDKQKLARVMGLVFNKEAYTPPGDPLAAAGAPPMPPGGGGDPMMGGGGAPPMPGGDPMMGGAPPMDPAMAMGGMPPVPPELMEAAMGGGGGMSMDPAMAGGAMPPMPGGDPAAMGMDPAMAGGAMPPEGGDPELLSRVDAMEDMLAQIAEALGIQVNEPSADAPPGTDGADMAAASDMGMDPAMAEGFNDEAIGMGGAPPELPPEMAGPETMKTASGDTVTISSMLQRMNQYS